LFVFNWSPLKRRGGLIVGQKGLLKFSHFYILFLFFVGFELLFKHIVCSFIFLLQKKDLQDYFKRLRFHYAKKSDQKIKYYAVGEYGSTTMRPHYHIIMLNCDDDKLISQTWGNGFTSISKITTGRIRYTLKYITKKSNKLDPSQQKEFSLMSKGLGSNYLTDNMKQFHRENLYTNSYTLTKEGYKIPIPKYYKEKIFDDEQKELLTEYLQLRSEYANEENAYKISIKKGTNFNLELKNLELSKINKKFDKNNSKYTL